MNEKLRVRRWRRLISELLRARADPAPPRSGEFLPTRCFGPLGDSEHLALGGLTGGHGHPTEPMLGEAPGSHGDAPDPAGEQ